MGIRFLDLFFNGNEAVADFEKDGEPVRFEGLSITPVQARGCIWMFQCYDAGNIRIYELSFHKNGERIFYLIIPYWKGGEP